MRSSVLWRFGAVAVLASAILLALPIDGTDNSDSDLVDLSSDGSDASTAPATSVSPTTMPSVSPTTMPSVSPTTMPSVSPSASPAAPSAADTIYTVSSNISFSDLDISAFDDASFSASFEANFQSQLAAYAGVDATDVEVSSIESGSVLVKSELTTTSSAAAATLVSGLSDDVSAVFTDESFASYGTISTLTVSSSSAPISSTTTPTLSPSLSPTLPSSAPSTSPTPLPFIETVLEGGKLNFEADLGQFMVGLTPVNVDADTFDFDPAINATQEIEEVWEPPVNSTDLTPSDLTSASVGPVPSLFLLGCVAGLAATAMVTIKRRRAASADCSTHEDIPLYTDYPRYS